MNASLELFRLGDGHPIPSVGFGMYRVPVGSAQEIAESALGVGYRHIDTAEYYRNEAQVGAAVRASGLRRSEVFVTSKAMPGRAGEDRAAAALRASLSALGLDHVDLYLVHWPAGSLGETARMWESMLALRDEGLARSVGVSNFGDDELSFLDSRGLERPAANQVQVHPAVPNRGAVSASRSRDILVEAWGPLGQGRVDYAGSEVGRIAARHGVTWAQVLLRWQLQQGRVVLPKSQHVARMQTNLDLWSFALSDDEVRRIDADYRP